MSNYYPESDNVVIDNGQKVKVNNSVLSFAKVFFYMFVGLAITTAVSFGVGYTFILAARNGATASTLSNAYFGVMISSAIALIVMSFVITFVTLRGKHSIAVPAIIYCVLMGVLLSSFTILLEGNYWLLGMAFGITAGIFLLMTLIAVLSKGNMSPLLMLGMGLFIGAGILALVNWIVGSSTIYWIVSFALFAAMMFITIFDIWNIKKICEKGAMSNNLALYCAFTLYVDFIYILIRVIYFLIIIFGSRRQLVKNKKDDVGIIQHHFLLIICGHAYAYARIIDLEIATYFYIKMQSSKKCEKK